MMQRKYNNFDLGDDQVKKIEKMSDISYLLKLEDLNDEITERNMQKIYDLKKQSGRLTVFCTVKIGNAGRGVDALSLWSEEKRLVQIETEGAFFYAYDGQQKIKLCQFMRNTWYAVYVSLDLNVGTYTLYIDGVRQLRNAEIKNKADFLDHISYGSNGGKLTVKKLLAYKNPIQSQFDIKRKVYDVLDYHIMPSDNKEVTEQLQNLIDLYSEQGGGVVYLRKGTYLTGCILLKSNVTLYIDRAATLKGVLDIEKYPSMSSEDYPNMNMIDRGPQKALIYAEGEENIGIMGGGEIDGSGDFYGEYRSESLRPSAILLLGCKHVTLCDVNLTNAGMWTIPLVETDHIYMRDLNIDSCWYPNRDGVDFCDCADVLIENCVIKADDDALCYKSGNACGCNNIVARNLHLISTMANGIKFGTYSYGGFANCICEDIVIKDCRICAICVESVDGGIIKNLLFRRISIRTVENPFFVIIGNNGRTPYWCKPRIGSIENIFFEDIDVTDVTSNLGNYIGGYRKGNECFSVKNIYFNHVSLETKGGAKYIPVLEEEFENRYAEAHCFGLLPASAFFIRHAENVQFNDCTIEVVPEDVREKIVELKESGK